MADETPTTPTPQTTPVETPLKASIAEQYELEEAPSLEPTAASAEGPAPAAVAPIPRNPDGTFAPRNPQETEPPAQPQRSQRLVQLALDMGMSDEEVSVSSNADLENYLFYVHRARQQAAKEKGIQAAVDGEQPAGAPAAPDDSLGPNEKEYDQELVGYIKALKKEMASLKGELAQVKAHQLRGHQESVADQCDRAFSKHSTILGEGTRHDFTKDSPEYAKRMAVLGIVQGMKTGTIEQRIDKAVNLLFGSAKPPTNGASLSQRQEEWRNGGLALPTHRGNQTELPGTAKATRSVKRILDETTAEPGAPDVLDDFPG